MNKKLTAAFVSLLLVLSAFVGTGVFAAQADPASLAPDSSISASEEVSSSQAESLQTTTESQSTSSEAAPSSEAVSEESSSSAVTSSVSESASQSSSAVAASVTFSANELTVTATKNSFDLAAQITAQDENGLALPVTVAQDGGFSITAPGVYQVVYQTVHPTLGTVTNAVSVTVVAPFLYAPQPTRPAEVFTAAENYLQDSTANPLPKWQTAIASTWVPKGFVLVEKTDEASGFTYWTLEEGVGFAAFAMFQNVTVNSVVELQDLAQAATENTIFTLSPLYVEDFKTAAPVTITINNPVDIIIDGNAQTLATSVANSKNFSFINNSTGTITLQNVTLSGDLGQGGVVLNKGIYNLDSVNFVNFKVQAMSIPAGTVTISNSTFSDFTSTAKAIVIAGANVTIQSTTFKNLNNHAIENNNSSTILTVDDTTFDTIRTGVAILGGKTVTIRNSYFKGNTAKQPLSTNADGGAIGLFNNGQTATLTIEGSTFDSNVSGDNAGALFMESSSTNPSAVTAFIKNNTFINNKATNLSSRSGGAIQLSLNVTATIVNNTFVGNVTSNNKGSSVGVYIDKSAQPNKFPVTTFYNNLFADNIGKASTYTNVDLELTPVAAEGNIGFDFGTARPADLTMISVFGTNTPVAGDNGSSIIAGKPGSAYAFAPTTVYIAPHLDNTAGIYADGAGVSNGSVLATDQRGVTRSSNKVDAGAVTINWAKFDANGGEWLNTSSYTYSTPSIYSTSTAFIASDADTVGAAVTPTRTGYNFLGWSTDATDATKIVTTFPDKEDDSTYYAIWQLPTYTVTYNAGGAQGTVPVDTTEYVANDTVTALAPDALTNAGFTFAGWLNSVDGQTYQTGDTFTIAQDVTLTAQWNAVPVTYTVTYNAGGGQGTVPTDATQYQANQVATVLSASGLSRTGYTFAGWVSSVDNALYQPSSTCTVTQNIVFTAQWTLIPPASSSSTPASSSSVPASSSSTPASSSSVPASSSSTPVSSSSTAPASSSSTAPAPSSSTTPAASSSSRTASSSAAASSSRAASSSVTSSSSSSASSVVSSSSSVVSSSSASVSSQPQSNSQSVSNTTLDDNRVPLFNQSAGEWALLNLLIAIVATVISAVLLLSFFRKKDENKQNASATKIFRIFAVVTGLLTPLFFFLTETMSRKMVFVDAWTVPTLLFLLVQGIFIFIMYKNTNKNNHYNNA